MKNFNPSSLVENERATPVHRADSLDRDMARASSFTAMQASTAMKSSGAYAVAAEERSMIESSMIPISPAQLDLAWGLGPTRSGVQINERTALTYVAVFAANRILAEALAMLPLKVYEGDEDSEENQPVPKHELYNVLRYEPNPEMTAATWKETGQLHLGLWGNSYGRIELSNRGKPRYLRPLMPDQIETERYAGELRYTSLATGDRFAPEEIIHIPGLGYNGIKGLSPVGLARETIASGKAAELFGSSYWANGTHIGGTLEYPGAMDPNARQAARQSISELHTGVGNAHRTLILDRGAKYTPREIPLNDAQFIETKAFSVRDIARLYRVPPHMLGDMEKAGYNTLEQMSLEFLVYSLTPWLTKWEQELTRKLFGVGNGFFVRFDTRALQRADLAALERFFASGRQWGYLSANDIRRKNGDPSIGKKGDIYLQPVNMYPAGQTPGGAANGGGMTFKEADEEPGKKPAEEKPAPGSERTAAAMSLRGVFEDAFARMLKVESNAIRRAGDKAASADWQKEFYSAHATNVRAALTPAAKSLCVLLDRDDAETAIAAALADPSEKRHAAGVDVAAAAASEAELLMNRIIAKGE